MKNTPHPNPLPQGARKQEQLPAGFDLDAFIAQFPLFARAPNGIANLRALILQLAVQGKLVPQDPNDEPASVLLEKIAAEKERLILEGKIKRQKPLAAIQEEENPFELPQGWVLVRIDEIFNVQGGIQKTPKRNPIKNYFPYLRVANVQRGYITVDQMESFELSDGELEKYALNDGDLLIVEGNGSSDEIGRCAVWNNQIENCVHQNHLIRVRGFFVETGVFITRFLNSLFGISEMKRLSITTSGLYTLSVGKIRIICVPLPPLEEQQRIVAKVDELMALCDQLEAQQDDQARNLLEANTAAVQAVTAFSSKTLTPQPPLPEVEGEQELVSLSPSTSGRGVGVRVFDQHWQRIATHFNTLYGTNLPLPSDMRRGKLKDRTVALENITKLRELILQLAVMGKLVPQDPNDEPASVLLEKIAAEKERLILEGKIKRQKPLDSIKKEEMFFELPKGWAITRFGDYSKEISTGPFGSMIHKHDYIENGVPLVNPSHMIACKIIPDYSISISKQKSEEFESYMLYENDIVMARRGEMGRCALVDSISNGWICGTGSFVLRFTSEVNRYFILLLFRAEQIKEYLGGNSVGTTMTNLNHGILNKMPIFVPPLEEQQRIVAQVDELMALCDTLETLLTEQRQVAADFSAAAVQAMGA